LLIKTNSCVRRAETNIYAILLKTSPTVNWGTGLKSISDDFYKQKVLNENSGIDITRTVLVCSDKGRVASLKQKTPNLISDFADILFLPIFYFFQKQIQSII